MGVERRCGHTHVRIDPLLLPGRVPVVQPGQIDDGVAVGRPAAIIVDGKHAIGVVWPGAVPWFVWHGDSFLCRPPTPTAAGAPESVRRRGGGPRARAQT